MKKILFSAVAVGALVLGANAFAQDADMFVSKDASGKMTVNGGPNNAPTELSLSNNGQRPESCIKGGYWQASKSNIVSCDDGKTQFSLEAPAAYAKMSNGQAYPEGSMIMKKSGG